MTAGVVGLVGAVFAGSPAALATGTTIAGVEVGGLSVDEATKRLEARASHVAHVPVVFTAGGKRFRLSSAQLGVQADWASAAQAARHEGDGIRPVRGLRRLQVRLFGTEIAPTLSVFDAALEYKLDQLQRQIDKPAAEPRLRRRGLKIVLEAGHAGLTLRRTAARSVIIRALGALERGATVALPVETAAPKVKTAALAPAAAQARIALSAPVRVTHGRTRWRLPRWRIAQLLSLPSEGATNVSVSGPTAEAYFAKLARTVARQPRDAGFAVMPGGVHVVPSATGLELDTAATMRAVAAAAFSSDTRVAAVVTRIVQPQRTTAEAHAMGIREVVGSYTTTYGGTPGRLHNVQLVARLIDSALVAPGATFSFNGTTGDRSAENGFQEAPVIINGELQTGIGGGVCQVSTTVFNAAFEAGLSIEERTNHALYISHYPLGRDATVNYPDLDLRFTNDTGKWLLLRTFVGAGSLTVNLYGTSPGRRVETETAPLIAKGAVPVKLIKDPTLKRGKRVVEDVGEPARQTSVRRKVYTAGGELLYDSTWRSTYVAEPTVVRVGTRQPPRDRAGQRQPPGRQAAEEGVTVVTPMPTGRVSP